jgi:hypothetical protein
MSSEIIEPVSATDPTPRTTPLVQGELSDIRFNDNLWNRLQFLKSNFSDDAMNTYEQLEYALGAIISDKNGILDKTTDGSWCESTTRQ